MKGDEYTFVFIAFFVYAYKKHAKGECLVLFFLFISYTCIGDGNEENTMWYALHICMYDIHTCGFLLCNK